MAKCPEGFTPTVKTSSYGDYEVIKVIDGGETIYCKRKKSTSPQTSDLPDWVNDTCLKKYHETITPLKKVSNYNEVEAMIQEMSKQNWFFHNDETGKDNKPLPSGKFFFQIKYDDGTKENGTWECKDGYVYLEVEGQNWNSKDRGKWVSNDEESTTDDEESTTDENTTTEDCSPFKDKEEANNFRAWVNEKLPNIAKDIPNLDKKYTKDRTLSKKGSCNNDYIKAASEHKINDKKLIDLFRSGEDVQNLQKENEEREEVYRWWENVINKKGVAGGSLVQLSDKSIYAKNHYAYKKLVNPDDKELIYLFFKDGTWISYRKGQGYEKKGTWDVEPLSESKSVKLISNLQKLISEQIIKTEEPHEFQSKNKPKKDEGGKDSPSPNPNPKSDEIFDEKAETEKVMKPIRDNALSVLDKWLNYNKTEDFSFFDLRGIGKTDVESAILSGKTTIGEYSPREFCSADVLNKLKKSKVDLEQKESELEKILTNEDKSYISQLKSLLSQVESECKKIKERKQIPNPEPKPEPKPDIQIKSDKEKKSELSTELVQIQKDKISELVSAGYEQIPNCDEYDPDRLIEKINLKDKYPNLFKKDICLVKYRELSVDSWNSFLANQTDQGFSALTKNVQGPNGKQNCRTVIRNTYDAQKNNLRTNNKFILQGVKDFVNECHRLYSGELGRRSNNRLEWLVYNSAAFRQLKESINNKKVMKNTLNKNIKKHLIETVENKKSVLVENQIIESRLKLAISEKTNVNSQMRGLIKETIKMKSVGINPKLISENLMDLIDVLYKDKSSKVKKVFNQESAKFISDKLGLEDGSFLRKIINNAFSDNSIEKTVELFNDCDYLSNIISNEVSNSLGFMDNTVEDMIAKTMKSEFKSMICPVISSMGDRMENQFKKMKSKALDKS